MCKTWYIEQGKWGGWGGEGNGIRFVFILVFRKNILLHMDYLDLIIWLNVMCFFSQVGKDWIEKVCPGLAAGYAGWPRHCWGADGEPMLAVTLTFLAKSIIPHWTHSQGRLWRQKGGYNLDLGIDCQNGENSSEMFKCLTSYLSCP